MNIITKYIAYLQDNPEHYWFKRKIYGWGWTPATWEGWLTIMVFLALLVWNFNRLGSVFTNVEDTTRPLLIETFIMVAVLLLICYVKGESPRWQWGFGDDDTDLS